jgi:D-glycero-alpha-D-manno-heptose-7-phosphate kinase
VIINRTPFRISFFGGGTDYPVWYKKHGGAVLSTSINKYCYINCRYLPPFFKYKYRLVYSQLEHTKTISEIEHPSARETLAYLNIDRGVDIHLHSDLPAKAGLGTSSSFTVGLLSALNALKGRMASKRQLAMDAIHIEQHLIQENVGSQDQVCAAFGGLNKIEFNGEREFIVHPITIKKEKYNLLQDNLLLFFTGFSRIASKIAEEQIKTTSTKEKELTTMHEMVDQAVDILNSSDTDLSAFGKLLHETWMIKRTLTDKISNPTLDKIYHRGIQAGALGGKILGAGGGGFMLLYVEPEKQARVKKELKELLYVPFRFDNLGSQIVYYMDE